MKIRPFEIVLITIFVVAGLAALALLSMYQPAGKAGPSLGASVIIWGTVPTEAFTAVLRPLVEVDKSFQVVQYVEKDARTFDNDLLNALADGNGPDIIFLPSEKLVQHRSRIRALTESNFPTRDFRDRYIGGADIFALADGVYAYPVAVDPLVMYYNRTLLGDKSIVYPPKTWPEMMPEIPTLVQKDYNRTISRAAVAFGEYANVTHAYDVLSLLLLQGGSSLVVEVGNQYKVLLDQDVTGNIRPLGNALNWYSFFSNPTKETYSWNSALPDDRSAFVSEKLVFYFGKGSEGVSLQRQNPNLKFDVTTVPQGGIDTTKRTYATFYGLSLLKASRNPDGALAVMATLGSSDKSKVIADALHMAPAHLSTLNAGSNDIYGRISYEAAKVARGWLAPAPDKVDQILRTAVESVRNNRREATDAATDAVRSMSEAY